MSKEYLLLKVENLFLLLAISYIYFGGLKSYGFHPDESQWIATSSVFEAYFTGDYSSSLWEESYWTYTQPPLSRYVIGLGRKMGGFDASELNAPWDFKKDNPENIAEGRKPSPGLLFWSRLPMGIIGVFTIFFTFIFIKNSFGRLPGYIWVALCFLSFYFPIILGRAMGEAPLLAGMAATLILSKKILQVSGKQGKNGKKKLFLYFLLLGIVIGLAESSKLNGLTVISAGFVFILLIGMRLEQTKARKILFGLISSTILFFSSQLVFFLLNPFLWKDPLNRTIGMFQNRVIEMIYQIKDYPNYRILGAREQFYIVIKRVFETYSALHFNGSMWVNIILFLIGCSYLIVNTIQYMSYYQGNPSSIAVLVVGLASSVPSLFTPLDWDRYYLIPIYFSTLTIAVGIWWSGLFVFRFLEKRMSFYKIRLFQQ